MTDKSAENPQSIPSVSVGNGEKVPWANKALTCPECGEDCELQDSKPSGLTFISHCGKSWLRGKPDFNRIFEKNGNLDD